MATTAVAIALDPVLGAVQTALGDAKGGGSVPLDAATLDPAGTGSGAAVAALIAAQLGGLTLTADATIGQVDGQDALLVKGPASGSVLGIDGPAVSATFTTASDTSQPSGLALEVVLRVATGTDWTLAKSFAQLGLTSLGQMTLDAGVPPVFVLRSADGPADAFGPIERAGLNLEVGVVMDGKGPFGQLATVLEAVSGTLRMAGPVATGKTSESIELRALTGVPSAGFPVSGLAPIGLASSAVVVTGAANCGSGGTWATGVELAVWALVSVGGSSVPFGVSIPIGAAAWRLFVVPNQGVHLFQLVEFVPGLSFIEALPDAVKNVVNVEIDTFSLTLGKGASGGWSAQSLQIMVSSDQPWTIVPHAVEVENVRVALATTWPQPGQNVSGTVGGVIGLDPVDGKAAVAIGVSIPIPLGSGDIMIDSTPTVALPGLGALTTLVGGAELTAQLPSGMADVGSFVLESFSAVIDPSGPALKEASISLSANHWTVIQDRLSLDGIVIDLDVRIGPQTAVCGLIAGTVTIGAAKVLVAAQRATAADDWTLSVIAGNVKLPSLEDIAELAGTDLRGLLPEAIADHHFVMSNLELDADLSKGAMQLFEIVIESEGKWVIVQDQFEIDQLIGSLTLDWRSGQMVPSGELRAVLDFGDLVFLELDAQRPPTGGWVLKGALEKPVDVTKLVSLAIGIEIDSGLASGIAIDVLSLTYHTLDGSYQFAVAASWKPKLAALQLEVDASLALERAPDPAKTGQWIYSGHIEGDMKSHFGSDELDLAIAYDFQPQGNSFVFKLGFNQLTLTATYKKIANGDETITARLTGVSFGELVEWLVNLVDPALHFELSAPWDVLNKIRFDDFAIVGNLTQRTIGVEYDPKLDLGIVDVQSLTLTYLHKGGSATIDIGIVGSFVGQSYPPEKPLTWDLLNDPPPATPGAGAALFDLQDLGVGQHLVLADPNADTMAKVMADVHEIIVNTEGKKPWDELKFDPRAGWLVAANFTVMGTVQLRLIFDDPVLYGVEVALSGDKAGPFAGLDFQILYRKVSDDVGVYHIELKLPDVMRHLEFGEVSVTLPIVVIDIYTDGGFYLDFGFPYNNNWTVCFGVQVFPFVGAGGFYIGRLTAADGATNLVPAITNGTFGPVIEFGVALAIGVGKDIDEGPLSAGVSVTVQGVLQGVVAWFNPTDTAQPSDRYYKIDGGLAIVGKLYGTVDFKVISISISLVASVTASVDIVAYGPIVLALSVRVEVEASIKILFIRINFSFTMQLNASFTIGSQQPTPWQLAGGGGAPPGQVAAQHPLAVARRLEGAHHLLAGPRALIAMTAITASEALDWQPVNVVGTKQVLTVTMLPVLTVAPDPKSGGATVTGVMAPSLDAPDPSTTTSTSTSFDLLVEALVKWGMQTRTGSHQGPVTAVDLELVYEDLTADAIAQGGFAYANVAAFLGANFAVAVAAPPAGTVEAPGAVLPMLPPLKMSPDGQPEVDFWSAQQVDAQWQQGVQQIFNRLAVNYQYDRVPDPLADGDTVADTVPGEASEAIAEALFGDWALMVARGALQAARDALSTASHTATAQDSLIALAQLTAPTVTYIARANDTAATIAELFGIPVAALLAANPEVDWGDLAAGTRVAVPPPAALATYVTVPGDVLAELAAAWLCDAAAIEAANPAVDFSGLAPGTPLDIPVPAALFAIAAANLEATIATGSLPVAGLTHQVLAGDTLAKIAGEYGNASAVVGPLGEANAAARGVLLAGASDTLKLAAASGTIPYTIASGDGLDLVAAFTYVRNVGAVPYAADLSWFANAIAQANPSVDFTAPLAASVGLTIPTVTETPSGPSPTGATTSYTPKAGDSLELVAGYFTMLQLHPGDAALVAAETGITTLNPSVDWSAAGAAIQLPAQEHTIVAGDTLGDLAGRFGLSVADVADNNANANVLTPNATLALPPGLAYPVAAGTRLSDLAGALGLSVDELAGRIGAVQGAVAAQTPLTLPNRRQMDVDDLVQAIAGPGTANVAGMASHFTLHGLRVPVPPDPNDPTNAALYALTGQQFPAPAQPLTNPYNIAFAVGDGSSWVYPVIPYKTGEGDTLQSLEQTYGPSVAELNPDVDWNNLQQGTLLRVPQPSVTVAIDQATLAAESPDTSLSVDANATVVALVGEKSVRHSVAAPVPWTAATPPVPPPTPGVSPPPRPSGSGLSLWRLPASLTSRAAADPTVHPYALMTSPKGRPVGDDPPQANYYAWGTWLPVTIRRVAAPDGGWLDGTYLVLGAGETDRDTLLGLWDALGTSEGVSLSLAYAAAAGGAGLVSDVLDPAATAVVKTNLSTETHSGAQAADVIGAVPASSSAYAQLAAPAQFLQLLWEASVVGTGGYYLTYAKDGGGSLPTSIWASGAEAQVYVIAVLDSALAAIPDRNLYPYTTGAVVADVLDPSRLDVFAEATDGSDVAAVASAPPGNIAFQLTRPNASPGPDPTPQERTQSLFSLLAYSIAGTGFNTSPLALPVGPTGTGDEWSYDQTVPVFRLSQHAPADMAPGLPPGADDPYAGIGAAAAVGVKLGFRDVFGNEIDAAVPDVSGVGVGYYDVVRGLSTWPGASAAYAIDGTSGAAVLELRVDLGLDKYVPSPANLFPVAVRTAAAHRTTYGQVHYQVQQPDVTFSVATSLDAPGTTHLTGSRLEAPLRGFVMAAYLYLGTAQAVRQFEHTVASGGEKLGAVATAYTLSAGQLLSANGATDASLLVDGDLTVPLQRAFGASDTLTAIAAAAGLASAAALLELNLNVPLAAGAGLVTEAWRYTTKTGDTLTSIAGVEDTTPAAVAVANTEMPGILDTTQSVTYGGKTQPIGPSDTFGTLAGALGTTVIDLAPANAGTPLFKAGVQVFIAGAPVPPAQTGGARSYKTQTGDMLAGVAASQRCTVAGLGLANGQVPVLDTTKSIDVGGTTVKVRDGTFATVVADLLADDTAASIADVAAAIANPADAADNVLLAGVTLAIPDYVVQAGDTIASILAAYPTAFTLDQVALLNGPLQTGLYPTGTLLTTGSVTIPPTPGESFAAIAAAAHVTIDQLAAANASTMLQAGQPIAIPGATTLGATGDAAYQVPFDISPTPALGDIATAFGTTPETLGTLNATMPDLVAAGVGVTYTPTGRTTQTVAGDTLATVAPRVGAADAGALAADAAVSGSHLLLAAGALLQCPLAQVNGRSLTALAQALGVDSGDLAAVNAALVGLIAPGQTLVVKHVDPATNTPVTATIVTAATDTLASLVRKLQQQVPAMELADLLAAYGGAATLLASVPVMVPPARVAVSAPLTNPQVKAPFAPVEVNVTIARDPALVDAAATAGGMTEVVSATTALTPDLDDYGGLAGFATAFETALAPLRIKLATGPEPDDAQRRLWVVDFGSYGFERVAVDGSTARFYALAPVGQDLASGPVSIRLYDPKTGTLATDPITQTFASIDLDAWMRTALDAIDLFLAPPVAAPAYRLSPTGLTTVVQNKGTIATALRDRVAEILDDPNPDADALAAAKEALYQSMLVTLGTAYTTDAIVQFPVAVQSPYGPTYTTGSADTFATVAAAYGVSPEAAQAQFATVAPSGAFPANTTLDQSAMLYTTGSADTFATLAGFFATDPGSVGIAALDVAGLVPAGTTVGTYQVQTDDKLRDIASRSGIAAATIALDLAQAGTALSTNVPVHCFSRLNPIAPRLFGKALVERYQAGSGNTSQQLLAWFAVSAATLGEAVAPMPGILCVGATVTNTANDKQYTVAAGDTFASLTGPLGAPDVGTLLHTLEVVTGAGLLQPGVALALGRVSRTPSAQDSLTTLAAYFDTDPASVAIANQDAASIFVLGTVFTLTSKATYTVKGPESLAQVAAALGTTPTGFATDPDVVRRSSIFNPSTTLHGLQPLPDFSLSTAKVPLVDGTQYASFLFGTSADASFKSLFLDLDFAAGEVEFQLGDVAAAPGYQESDWLRFGVPLDAPPLQPGVQLDAGQVDVPIPLRVYPQLPLMRSLDAYSTWAAPTTIAEAKQWHLAASVEHQSAAQDEALLEVSFNAGAPTVQPQDEDTSLFEKLAQLVTAWPALQHDVAALAALAPGAPDPGGRLTNMVGAFATLVADLAGAVSAPSPLAEPDGAQVIKQTYTFLLDSTYDASDTYLESVQLVLQPGSTTTDVPWPAIWVETSDGQNRRLTADPPDESTESRRYYYPADTVPAFGPLTHRYVLPDTAVPAESEDEPRGRDAVKWQSGEASAAVRRNAELVGTAATAPAFVYQTPWISFSSPAVPLLQTAAPISLADGSGFQDRLAAGLTELLTVDGVTLDGTYNVKLLCRYALELATPTANGNGAGPPIVELLPVFYVPLWGLSVGTLTAFAATAAGQVMEWLGRESLTAGAADVYVLDLSLFASGDAQMVRPLVELSGLTIGAD